GLDPALEMPPADAFTRPIRAVVEEVRMFFVRFPKGAVRRLHRDEFRGWINMKVITHDRAIHRVAGNLLRARAERFHGWIVDRTKINFRMAQRRPDQAALHIEDSEPGRRGFVEPA